METSCGNACTEYPLGELSPRLGGFLIYLGLGFYEYEMCPYDPVSYIVEEDAACMSGWNQSSYTYMLL